LHFQSQHFCFSFVRGELLVLRRQRGARHSLRRNVLAARLGRQAIQHATRTCHANPQGALFQCPANPGAIGLHRVQWRETSPRCPG
jgi:hypothetical protein